eukprot:SAG31_NODE_31435_length_368_cov_0.828996_1_plen_48_part_10
MVKSLTYPPHGKQWSAGTPCGSSVGKMPGADSVLQLDSAAADRNTETV